MGSINKIETEERESFAIQLITLGKRVRQYRRMFAIAKQTGCLELQVEGKKRKTL